MKMAREQQNKHGHCIQMALRNEKRARDKPELKFRSEPKHRVEHDRDTGFSVSA